MLTTTQIKNLKPKANGKPRRVSDNGPVKGLAVHISGKGHKSFVLRYSKDGKVEFHKIGDVDRLGLKEARDLAFELRGQLEAGENPRSENTRVSEKRVATYKDLVDAYIENCMQRDVRCVGEIETQLEKNTADLFEIPANEVTPQQVADCIRAIVARGSVGMATRVRGFMHAAFQFGASADLDPMRTDNGSKFGISHNPVALVPKPQKGSRACTRALTEDEVAWLWHEIAKSSGPRMVAAVRLLLCTGCRVEEILNLHWDDVRSDHIFLRNTKPGHPDTVPLNDLAVGVLKWVRQETGHYPTVFPAKGASYTPMRTHSVNHAVTRIAKKAGIPHFAPRDLRRTVKTLAVKHGIPIELMNKLQRHALRNNVADRHYNMYEYDKEKRIAVDEWGNVLRKIIRKGAGLKVVGGKNG